MVRRGKKATGLSKHSDAELDKVADLFYNTAHDESNIARKEARIGKDIAAKRYQKIADRFISLGNEYVNRDRIEGAEGCYESAAEYLKESGNYRDASSYFTKAAKSAETRAKTAEEDSLRKYLDKKGKELRKEAKEVRHEAVLHRLHPIKQPFARRSHHRRLEHRIAASVLTIVSFVIALTFASASITGYNIAINPQWNYNLLGVIFFFLGLVGAYFLLRKQ